MVIYCQPMDLENPIFVIATDINIFCLFTDDWTNQTEEEIQVSNSANNEYVDPYVQVLLCWLHHINKMPKHLCQYEDMLCWTLAIVIYNIFNIYIYIYRNLSITVSLPSIPANLESTHVQSQDIYTCIIPFRVHKNCFTCSTCSKQVVLRYEFTLHLLSQYLH